MPVRIDIGLDSELQDATRQQIATSVGEHEGGWNIIIRSRQASVWDVLVRGPGGFRWARRFREAECNPRVIGQKIRAAIDVAAAELPAAMAELAKSGIAYTTEKDPGGRTVYIIDKVRLGEDELLYLKKAGALNREGIRQYLVDRAA